MLLVCLLPATAFAEAVELERVAVSTQHGDHQRLQLMQVTVIHAGMHDKLSFRPHMRAARTHGRKVIIVPRKVVLEQLERLRHFVGRKMKDAGLIDERSTSASPVPNVTLEPSAETARLLQSTTIVVSEVSDPSESFGATLFARPRYVLRIFERRLGPSLLPLAEKLLRHGRPLPAYVRNADVEIGSYFKDNSFDLRSVAELKGNQLLGEVLTRRARGRGKPLKIIVQTSKGARERLYTHLGFSRRGEFIDQEESILRRVGETLEKQHAQTVMLYARGHRKIVRALQAQAKRHAKPEEVALLRTPFSRPLRIGSSWRSNAPSLRPGAHTAQRAAQRSRELTRARRATRHGVEGGARR